MILTEFLVILCLVVLFAQFFNLQRRRSKLPPGPSPLPLIGNLWNLRFQLHHEYLIQLAKSYGNIYTLWLGRTPVIVLNGCKVIRDALVSHPEELSGRPESCFYSDVFGKKGIGFSNGDIWKQQRRILMMAMRNFGLGKRILEQRIHNEAQHLLEDFARKEGRALDPTNHIIHSVANVISAMVIGHRFSAEEDVFTKLVEAVEVIISTSSSSWGRIYDAFPRVMAHLPGPHQNAFKSHRFLKNFIQKEIQAHRERRTEDEPEDFIDFYDAQILKSKDDPDSTYDEDHMTSIMIDVFIAGIETTRITLHWSLLYMVMFPEVQEKVQKELDAIIGKSERICYEDRNRLPYTHAVIHEVHRYATINGPGLIRECMNETHLQGFKLSKGTLILPNLSSALYDPECWETPQQFNPNHFLDKEGNFVTKEAFLPFSAGPRSCPGEQLARIELFLFFSNLLRTFTLKMPPGIKKFRLDYMLGGTLAPYPYNICAVPR